jgi:hypothetical protein
MPEFPKLALTALRESFEKAVETGVRQPTLGVRVRSLVPELV